MSSPTPSIGLEAFEETRKNLRELHEAARGAPTQLQEALRVWDKKKGEMRKAVLEHDGLQPLEQAGWLLVINSATLATPDTDLAESADATIARLQDLDRRLKQPGTPILTYSREFNLYKASGEGIFPLIPEYSPKDPSFKIGTAEQSPHSPSLCSVEPDVLMAAVTDPEAIYKLNFGKYAEPWYRPTLNRNCMVIGKETVIAFVEALLREYSYRDMAGRITFDISTMAKHQGLQLEEESETIAEKLQRWKARVVQSKARAIQEAVMSNVCSDTGATQWTEKEFWSELVTEVTRWTAWIGVAPEGVINAAQQHNRARSKEVARRLKQLSTDAQKE